MNEPETWEDDAGTSALPRQALLPSTVQRHPRAEHELACQVATSKPRFSNSVVVVVEATARQTPYSIVHLGGVGLVQAYVGTY